MHNTTPRDTGTPRAYGINTLTQIRTYKRENNNI